MPELNLKAQVASKNAETGLETLIGVGADYMRSPPGG